MALTGASRYSRRPSRRSPRSGDWLLTLRRSKLAVEIRQDKEGIITLVIARAPAAEYWAASCAVAA